MLEKMAEFFEARLEGYDAHMLNDIEGADKFYPFTADCLPKNGKILDLGCGTGLELEFYFTTSPHASVVGIDLSRGMLDALKKKFDGRKIELICGSYFDVPFGENVYDAAVSVESLHHFAIGQKTQLYTKVLNALCDSGYFIITDYFAKDDAEEESFSKTLAELRFGQNINDDEFYHFDTPLTVGHEIGALFDAGFSSVEVLKNWGATYTLKAIK